MRSRSFWSCCTHSLLFASIPIASLGCGEDTSETMGALGDAASGDAGADAVATTDGGNDGISPYDGAPLIPFYESEEFEVTGGTVNGSGPHRVTNTSTIPIQTVVHENSMFSIYEACPEEAVFRTCQGGDRAGESCSTNDECPGEKSPGVAAHCRSCADGFASGYDVGPVYVRRYDIETGLQDDPVPVWNYLASTAETHSAPHISVNSDTLYAWWPVFFLPGYMANTFEAGPLKREFSARNYASDLAAPAVPGGILSTTRNTWYERDSDSTCRTWPPPDPWPTSGTLRAGNKCGLRFNDGTTAWNGPTFDSIHLVLETFGYGRGGHCGSGPNEGAWCDDNGACSPGTCGSNYISEHAGNGAQTYFRLPHGAAAYDSPKVLINSAGGAAPDADPSDPTCQSGGAFQNKPYLVARNGVLHLSWPSLQYAVGDAKMVHNYDLFYARSTDDGLSWTNLTGEVSIVPCDPMQRPDCSLSDGLPYHRNDPTGRGGDFLVFEGEVDFFSQTGVEGDSQGHPVFVYRSPKPGTWATYCGHVIPPGDSASNVEYELRARKWTGRTWNDVLLDDAVNWAHGNANAFIDAEDRIWVFASELALETHPEIAGIKYKTSTDGGESYSAWVGLTREATAGQTTNLASCARWSVHRDPERRWVALSCALKSGINRMNAKFLRVLP